MPVTRDQLPSVAGFDRRLDFGGAAERISNRFARWVLGAGFLAVDLALFGVSLLVAYTWALIAHPTDLDSIAPFRYWGIVAIVHTILTGGGLLAWKLLGMDEPATHTAVPAYGATTHRPAPAMTAWTQTAPVDAVVAQPRPSGRAQGSRRVPWASRPVEQNWPHQPELLRSQPGATVDPDVGEATWPESIPLSTSLGVSASNPGEETAAARPSPSQSWFEAFLGSRSSGQQKPKEQRWSWVEAAAGSWLSRRDQTSTPENADPAATDIVISPADTDQPQA